MLKERSLRELKGRCMWLGYIPEQDLKYAYGIMDLLIYPSRFATESGALLTALGYGRVVLTSDLPPFREKEQLGALKTYSDFNTLKSGIDALLKDEDMRNTPKANALKYCTENSWSNVAKKHIDLYNDLVYP